MCKEIIFDIATIFRHVAKASVANLDKEIHENLDVDKFWQICAILCSFPHDNTKGRKLYSLAEFRKSEIVIPWTRNISICLIQNISFIIPCGLT